MFLPALVITPTPLDAAGHMALDEALLDLAPAPFLRFYRWKGPAVTFGYSQRWEDAVEAAGRIDDVVRRATGGGIVFHDGAELTFSYVFDWDKSSDPCAVYKDLHRAIHIGFKAQGLQTRLWSPGRSTAGVQMRCFSGPEAMDLVDEAGRKVLGGALRKRAGKGLYQGSLRMPDVTAGTIWRALGKPPVEIKPEWEAAGAELEHKYRSDDWNKRR